MLLESQDAQLFFKLHRALMFFVNERLHVLPDKISSPDEFSGQPPEARLKVREALLDEIDLIEAFVDKNPAGFAEDELEIVLSWHHLVSGSFFIFRNLKRYTVFLSSEKEPIAYGVTALTQPFEELVGPYLPVMTETVLLPFKDKIIYDGLLAGPGVSLSFGGHGHRILFRGEAEEDAFEDIGGEARAVAFASQIVFDGSVRRQDGHCQASQHGGRLGRLPLANSAGVLGKSYIQNPM